jgi:hypothetical protein
MSASDDDARRLLASDHRAERMLVWKGLLAAAATVAVGLARSWWWT